MDWLDCQNLLLCSINFDLKIWLPVCYVVSTFEKRATGPYELRKSVSWVFLANQGSLFARQPRCITYLRSLRSSIKSFMFLSLSCLASPLVPLYMKSTNDSPWDAHVWQHVTIRSLRIWGSIPVMFSTLMFPVWVKGNWFTYGGKRR